MVDFNADIMSFISLGNVHLGDSIDLYLEDIFNNYTVEIKEYALPAPLNETRYVYSVQNGTLIIATTTDDIIVSVGCNQKYAGKYKGKLYAGITMEELSQCSKDLRILNGALIVDQDYGLSFTLPPPYDEIADSLEQIPHDLSLNEIYVCDHSGWVTK
ncbi:hypothetical protein [Kosakonia sacchari]|uniref:hypothetical protein n=1 Tax=Kosakonia sacchari TaxID=1158459 RepID=UPI0015855362|nr:hypothetical protein [Kosakonia sacchari]NUL38960.1 hypothetical protein [Kosakonia sacchari]